MIKIVQHRMGALVGETESAEVETMADALALDWVAQWTTHPGFFRWSVSWDGAGESSPRGPLPARLMAEMGRGHEWWVVAFLYNVERADVDLPEWHPPGYVIDVQPLPVNRAFARAWVAAQLWIRPENVSFDEASATVVARVGADTPDALIEAVHAAEKPWGLGTVLRVERSPRSEW